MHSDDRNPHCGERNEPKTTPEEEYHKLAEQMEIEVEPETIDIGTEKQETVNEASSVSLCGYIASSEDCFSSQHIYVSSGSESPSTLPRTSTPTDGIVAPVQYQTSTSSSATSLDILVETNAPHGTSCRSNISFGLKNQRKSSTVLANGNNVQTRSAGILHPSHLPHGSVHFNDTVQMSLFQNKAFSDYEDMDGGRDAVLYQSASVPLGSTGKKEEFDVNVTDKLSVPAAHPQLGDEIIDAIRQTLLSVNDESIETETEHPAQLTQIDDTAVDNFLQEIVRLAMESYQALETLENPDAVEEISNSSSQNMNIENSESVQSHGSRRASLLASRSADSPALASQLRRLSSCILQALPANISRVKSVSKTTDTEKMNSISSENQQLVRDMDSSDQGNAGSQIMHSSQDEKAYHFIGLNQPTSEQSVKKDQIENMQYATPSQLHTKITDRKVTIERGGVGSQQFDYATPSTLMNKVENIDKLSDSHSNKSLEHISPSHMVLKTEVRDFMSGFLKKIALEEIEQKRKDENNAKSDYTHNCSIDSDLDSTVKQVENCQTTNGSGNILHTPTLSPDRSSEYVCKVQSLGERLISELSTESSLDSLKLMKQLRRISHKLDSKAHKTAMSLSDRHSNTEEIGQTDRSQVTATVKNSQDESATTPSALHSIYQQHIQDPVEYRSAGNELTSDYPQYSTPSRLLQKCTDRQVTLDKGGVQSLDMAYTSPSQLLSKVEDRESPFEKGGISNEHMTFATASKLLHIIDERFKQNTSEEIDYSTPSKLLQKVIDRQITMDKGGVPSEHLHSTTPSKLLHKIENRHVTTEMGGVPSEHLHCTTPSDLLHKVEKQRPTFKSSSENLYPTTPSKLLCKLGDRLVTKTQGGVPSEYLQPTTPSKLLRKVHDREVTINKGGVPSEHLQPTTPSKLLRKVHDREVTINKGGVLSEHLQPTTPSKLLRKVHDREVTINKGGVPSEHLQPTTPSKLLRKVHNRGVTINKGGVPSEHLQPTTPSKLLRKVHDREVTINNGGVPSGHLQPTTPSKLLRKVHDREVTINKGGVPSDHLQPTTSSKLLSKVQDREITINNGGVPAEHLHSTTPSKLLRKVDNQQTILNQGGVPSEHLHSTTPSQFLHELEDLQDTSDARDLLESFDYTTQPQPLENIEESKMTSRNDITRGESFDNTLTCVDLSDFLVDFCKSLLSAYPTVDTTAEVQNSVDEHDIPLDHTTPSRLLKKMTDRQETIEAGGVGPQHLSYTTPSKLLRDNETTPMTQLSPNVGGSNSTPPHMKDGGQQCSIESCDDESLDYVTPSELLFNYEVRDFLSLIINMININSADDTEKLVESGEKDKNSADQIIPTDTSPDTSDESVAYRRLKETLSTSTGTTECTDTSSMSIETALVVLLTCLGYLRSDSRIETTDEANISSSQVTSQEDMSIDQIRAILSWLSMRSEGMLSNSSHSSAHSGMSQTSETSTSSTGMWLSALLHQLKPLLKQSTSDFSLNASDESAWEAVLSWLSLNRESFFNLSDVTSDSRLSDHTNISKGTTDQSNSSIEMREQLTQSKLNCKKSMSGEHVPSNSPDSQLVDSNKCVSKQSIDLNMAKLLNKVADLYRKEKCTESDTDLSHDQKKTICSRSYPMQTGTYSGDDLSKNNPLQDLSSTSEQLDRHNSDINVTLPLSPLSQQNFTGVGAGMSSPRRESPSPDQVSATPV